MIPINNKTLGMGNVTTANRRPGNVISGQLMLTTRPGNSIPGNATATKTMSGSSYIHNMGYETTGK